MTDEQMQPDTDAGLFGTSFEIVSAATLDGEVRSRDIDLQGAVALRRSALTSVVVVFAPPTALVMELKLSDASYITGAATEVKMQ